MDEDIFGKVALIGVLVVLLLVLLTLPIEGVIFGETIVLPLAGWIAFAALAIIALYLFFKHRA